MKQESKELNVHQEINVKNNKSFAVMSAFLAGSTEPFIGYMPIAWKIGIQQGLQMKNIVKDNPLKLYKGFFAFQINVALSTAIEILVMESLKEKISAKGGVMMDTGFAFAGGAAASLIACPAENLILHQQRLTDKYKQNFNLKSTFKYLNKERGISFLYRGLAATSIREMGFSASVWSIKKNIQAELENNFNFSPFFSTVAGSLLGALPGSILFHWSDVVATYQKKEIDNLSMSQAIKMIYKEGGARKFMLGCNSRIISIASASLFIPYFFKMYSEMLNSDKVKPSTENINYSSGFFKMLSDPSKLKGDKQSNEVQVSNPIMKESTFRGRKL